MSRKLQARREREAQAVKALLRRQQKRPPEAQTDDKPDAVKVRYR